MPTAFWRCLLLLSMAPSIAFLQEGRPSSESDTRGSAAAPAASVIRLYRASCLKCHDTDGKGEIVRDVMSKIPDFTDDAWHATRKDADLSRSILEGKGKSMPSMRGKLGSVGVGQLVAFVRGFRGGKQVVDEEESESPTKPPPSTGPVPTTRPHPAVAEPPRPDPKDLANREGGRTFQRSCAVCHGTDGRGGEMRGSLPSIPDFTVGTWQEAHTDPQLVVSVLDGRGAGMPPFRDKLSRDQAREVVAIIRSFGPSSSRVTRTSTDDFEARFQQLLSEFEDLSRRIRSLPDDGHSAPDRPTEPAQSPPTRQARPSRPQSSGDGSGETGG